VYGQISDILIHGVYVWMSSGYNLKLFWREYQRNM
jgi:hypothetical protein